MAGGSSFPFKMYKKYSLYMNAKETIQIVRNMDYCGILSVPIMLFPKSFHQTLIFIHQMLVHLILSSGKP